ncbi:MAG: AEC family transporter [Methyloprofundus sp.]|nr:AEC family transporter [Methyloprofundus sp.]
MLEQFSFALGVTAPILSLLVLGVIFRRSGFISQEFIDTSNSFVFNISLPCLLFFSIARTPLTQSGNIPLFLFGFIVTLGLAFVFWLLSCLLLPQDKRGVFTQGAFRGNLGIIGIALVVNAYGNEMLAVASLYMAVIAVLDNPLAIFILKPKGHHAFKSILTNPIIIAVVMGLVFAAFSVPIPSFVKQTGQYLAQLTLPLALICIGGSLYWRDFQHHHKEVVWATIAKLILMPLMGILIAIELGFRGQELGLLYLMLSSPTAVSSYIMAKKMTAHGTIAAEIIALTTAASSVVITIGLIILQVLGYI